MTVPPHLHIMICDYLADGRYEVGPHVMIHAQREGFSQADVRAAIRSGVIIEVYSDRRRCLLVARIRTVSGRESWLHVVCDYGDRQLIGIITAYRPDPIEWEDPPVRRRTSI